MSSNSGNVEDTISGAFVLVDNKVFRRQTRLAWQTLGHFRATNQSHSKIVDPVRMRCDMCFSKTRHFDPFCPYTFSLLCCCLIFPRKRIIRKMVVALLVCFETTWPWRRPRWRRQSGEASQLGESSKAFPKPSRWSWLEKNLSNLEAENGSNS